MQLSHDFGVDLKSYAQKGKKNHFPVYDSCPRCHSRKRLHRHGYYWRNGVTDIVIQRVLICRLYCTICRGTCSILPSFFIPFFQHTISTVLNRLEEKINNRKIKGYRQLTAFYLHRFMGQLNWIRTFFVDQGKYCGGEKTGKEKAKKYMIMIRDFGESTFLRRSKGHMSSYFMAGSL